MLLNNRTLVVVLGVLLALVRIAWRMHVQDSTPGPVALSPTYVEANRETTAFRDGPLTGAGATPVASSPASAAPTTGPSAAAVEAQTLLNLIRAHGYRVTTHRLLDAVEMRAATIGDRANPVAARVDASGRGADDDLRCARQLAEKLGLN